MKNNEIFSSNLKNDYKSKGVFKFSKKSPNCNNLKKNKKRSNLTLKDSQKKIKDISYKNYLNNLNSFSIETNSLQNMLCHLDISNTGYNYINNNKSPYPSNNQNRAIFQNKNNNNNNDIKKKQTVNLSKNIEDIIKRRIIDKQIKNNSQKKNYIEKKLTFVNTRTTTVKNLKKNSSMQKKLCALNKKSNIKKNKIINKETNIEKEENNQIQKYSETKRVSACSETDKLDEENNDNKNEEEIIHLSILNTNTQNSNNEKMYKFYEQANSFRGMNYDYDSCFEDDIKSRKSHFIKSYSRSNIHKNKSKNKEYNINYTYDTINPDLIYDYHESSRKNINKSIEEDNKNNIKKENQLEKKDSNDKNENNEKNEENAEPQIDSIDILNLNKSEENENENEHYEESNKSSKDSKSESKDKKIKNNTNLNNSSLNKEDLSSNININSTDNNSNSKERDTILNNSIPEIKENKNEVNNINKIITTTLKNINLNLKYSNSEQKRNKNNSKEKYIMTDVNTKNLESKVNSERNPGNMANNNVKENTVLSNTKQNVYAPKRITNYFTLKHNDNIELINNNKDIKEKENNINSHRTNKITYSKKLPPSIVYFQKNSVSYNCKNDYENNQSEVKCKKNKSKFKLNSSFEGTKNLQMNNIFMNNNVYNNNFNYPYGGTNAFINTETNNNYMDMKNCYYNLNSNTNNIFYEINNPYAQLFLQMNNNNNNNNNNYNNNNNNNLNNIKLFNLNNSLKNNCKNNNQIENKEDLFNKINFEDFIVLEGKLKDIKNTLSRKNIIINECFEYLNYYYNSSIYKNIDCLFENDIDINNLKTCLGHKLLSIIICYNCSLDINNFEQTHLLLKEIMEINYKNSILLFEYILENIISNNGINIKNNLWLLKMKNIINNYKNLEQNNTYNEYISLNNNTEMTTMEKIKLNTTFMMKSINTILTSLKLKNSEILLTIFKSMNEKLYSNIFFYFFNYILHIINYKGSVIGNTMIQNQLLNNVNVMMPYIKTKNIKKYSLVLDLEETLLHFNMNINKNNEGVVDIRPGTIKFLDDISEYYELIVFNEGEQKYTDLLIDSLEENKIYFEHRFYREHIIIDNNDVVKDLNRIGRALDKILIVDNMSQNFKFQKNNGILIKSFWGDNRNDKILSELAIILIKIAQDGGDIRNGLIKYKNEIVNKIMIGNDTTI